MRRRGIAKELCKEERDGEFYGIKRYCGIWLYDMGLLDNREVICRTAFIIYIENIENLENLTLDLTFASLRHSPYDTKSADLSGQQINNETLIAIFHCSEHYTTGFLLHNRHKSTKIQQITKDFSEKIWRIAKKDVPLHPQLAKTG